jgi:hypothetical protein
VRFPVLVYRRSDSVPEASSDPSYRCASSALATLKILEENSYVHARTLRFVRIDELKEMCFRFGEIAAFRDAVEVWSELRVV